MAAFFSIWPPFSCPPLSVLCCLCCTDLAFWGRSSLAAAWLVNQHEEFKIWQVRNRHVLMLLCFFRLHLGFGTCGFYVCVRIFHMFANLLPFSFVGTCAGFQNWVLTPPSLCYVVWLVNFVSCYCWSCSCGYIVFWGSYLWIIGCSLHVGTFLPLATDAFVVFFAILRFSCLLLVL